ncbi:MAG: hypothetical protein WCP01_15915, partial [Methylococcaceae bacterium]
MMAKQFSHREALITGGEIIKMKDLFVAEVLGDEGSYCVATFPSCQTHENKYLPKISLTVFFSALPLLLLLLGFSPANADWHGDLSFRSDYVYRGYSKSQGNPVVQGLIDYE